MAEPRTQARGGAVVVALVAGCYAAAGAQASRSLLRDEPWDRVRLLVKAWRPLLAAEDREFRRAQWAALGMTQLVAGLVAAAAVVADDSAPGVWALAVALSAFVVVPLRWFDGRRRRVQELQSQVNA